MSRVRRPWARPLVPVYRAVQRLAEAWRGRRAAERLVSPVVSVGSISAGGAGKTPVVIALAEMFAARGWGVDVLSRGYGREGRGVERVSADVEDAAARFGDEPVLIARRAGVPVWVGARRYEAGSLAEDSPRAEQKQILGFAKDDKAEGLVPKRQVHLLDDGFQHRALARDFDVVLVTAEDLQDALLPAGNLREPVEALRRADAVVIRAEEAEQVEAPLLEMLRARSAATAAVSNERTDTSLGVSGWQEQRRPRTTRASSLVGVEALLWQVRRTLRFPAPLFCFGAGLRPLAFCAIARPGGFAEMLEEAGCGVIDTVFFADHHRYEMSDVSRLIELAKELQASGFVTTEKDAVKLSAAMRGRIEAEVGPLMVAELVVEFVYPERVMRELESRLSSARGDLSNEVRA